MCYQAGQLLTQCHTNRWPALWSDRILMVAHQVVDRGSQTDNSVPEESSASRKSSRSVLPRSPPKMKTYGPTAATACLQRRVTSSPAAADVTGVHQTPAACTPKHRVQQMEKVLGKLAGCATHSSTNSTENSVLGRADGVMSRIANFHKQ
jgi:hypothetical protein